MSHASPAFALPSVGRFATQIAFPIGLAETNICLNQDGRDVLLVFKDATLPGLSSEAQPFAEA